MSDAEAEANALSDPDAQPVLRAYMKAHAR
jgi:hypothetical protein